MPTVRVKSALAVGMIVGMILGLLGLFAVVQGRR
jgi:hypothetical protein